MGCLAAALLLTTTFAFAQPAPEPARPWEVWEPPTVTLPVPNAFDTYLAAFDLKAELDAEHVTEPPPGAPPDEWNEGPPDLPLADRVRLYDEVLTLVREALPLECRIPPMASAAERLPYFAKFRATARLLHMEAAAHCEVGEYGAAAQSALDCLEMAQDAASQRMIISWLVAAAVESTGMKGLDQAIPGLTAEECRAALVRLQRIESQRIPLTEALDGEEVFARILLKAMAEDPEGMAPLVEGAAEAEGNPVPVDMSEAALARSWQAVTPSFDYLRALAEAPYGTVAEAPPGDLLMADTRSQLVKTVWTDRRVRAVARLRMVQLAARAYALEQGQLPAALGDLVPDYLGKVPDDPFATGPLRARPAEEKLVIYSVGPDGVDDGGTAIEGVVKEEAKGDMVVEVAAE